MEAGRVLSLRTFWNVWCVMFAESEGPEGLSMVQKPDFRSFFKTLLSTY